MLFTFKRDEEGFERIYVGDVCVAELKAHDFDGSLVIDVLCMYDGVHEIHLDNAIEPADEAGFWKKRSVFMVSPFDKQGSEFIVNEVIVDVPVADNAVLSVTVGGDES